MHERIDIGGVQMGSGAPCYVIAEAGANHNRDLGIARELIEVASEAGASAVKFQTYSGDRLYSTRTPAFGKLAGGAEGGAAEKIEAISLPREWQPQLADHARDRGIAFMSTPFDHAAVDDLVEVGVPALKIASFELVDVTLIRKAASTSLPLLLSTGMATMGEIEEAITVASQAGSGPIALLQCTSLYPAPPRLMNLRAMETMSRSFGVPVGLSDHTEGTAVAIAAAALGAAVIEKHYTLDRSMEGPDHSFAVEPDELKALVQGIREAEAALGDGRKTGPSEEESGEQFTLGRRSVVVVGDHPAGTPLTREMLTVKRPGFGIKPREIERLVGRPLRVDVEHDEVLTWEMV